MKKLLTLLLFTSNLYAYAQVPTIMWDKTFGGGGIDQLHDLQITSDGGYILAGYSESGISGDKSQVSQGLFDYWVLKLDLNGNKQWEKSFGGSGFDALHSVLQTSDGGYLLCGGSDSGISIDKSQPSQGGDGWIIKLDANGNKIWDKTLGGNAGDGFNCIRATLDGGYILGGSSLSGISGVKTSTNNGAIDYWIVKIDALGNILWDKSYGGNGNEGLISIQQTTDGGYILGGFSDSGISGDKSQISRGDDDYWIVKIDATGNKVWDKTYGGIGYDVLYTIQQTFDGGYIVGGLTDSGSNGDISQSSQGSYDNWVIKLDAAGNKLWDKNLGGSGVEDYARIIQTLDGNYILGSFSNSNISGDKSENRKGGYDLWLVKIDNLGNKIWDKTLGGIGGEQMSFIKQMNNGSYIFGGTSSSPVGFDKSQVPNGISDGAIDYWILKSNPDVLSASDLLSSTTITISPNPNNGKFKLHLKNIISPTAEIMVTDELGRTVYKQQFKTINNQLFQQLNLPKTKGIYLLQVKTGDKISTQKIVIE